MSAGEEIRDAGAVVAREALPRHAVLTGFWAPLLAMDSPYPIRRSIRVATGPVPTHIIEETGFFDALPEDIVVLEISRVRLPRINKTIVVGQIQDHSKPAP